MSVESAAGQSGGSSSEKGIAYNATFCASSLNWCFNELFRKSGEMRASKAADRDGPHTAFIPAAGIESVAADALQNFKRTGFAWRGIDLMAHRVKVLIIPAKGLDAPLGNQTVRFVLRFKEVI